MLNIRAARPEEAAGLSAIAMDAKRHWGYAPAVLESWREQLTVSEEAISRHPTYVAEDEGMILGFYMLQGQDLNWTLEHLWVLPDLHGRGIGSGLLRHALDLALIPAGARVRVLADPNAAGFYERHGGTQVGAEPAPIAGLPLRSLPVYEYRAH